MIDMNDLHENREQQILSMDEKNIIFVDPRQYRADCTNCFGLCCVALYFSTSEGFPVDKEAGQPCPNLKSDFRCGVHNNLRDLGLKGCSTFDCFGAGPKIAQLTFKGQSWREKPDLEKEMFQAFLIMRQLHELLWYLSEALTLKDTAAIHTNLSKMINETEKITHLKLDSLLKVDVAAHRAKVNELLLQTSELVRAEVHRGKSIPSEQKKRLQRGADLIGSDLRKLNLKGANLRGALLIAADLRKNDLSGTDLIGADFRDTDLRGTDLSKSLFLTQAQINSAKGDATTKLPPSLDRPIHWSHTEK